MDSLFEFVVMICCVMLIVFCVVRVAFCLAGFG